MYLLLFHLHLDLKIYRNEFNKIFLRFPNCPKGRKVLQQQQQLLPDISSVCSIYIMHDIVNNSSEKDWYNCLVCFPKYFTNLSKLHNFLFSNFGLLNLTRFVPQRSYSLLTGLYITYGAWKKYLSKEFLR